MASSAGALVDDVLIGLASPSRETHQHNSSIMGLSPVNASHALGSKTGDSMSASSAVQQREIVRIHELWQKAKAELRNKNRELADLRSHIAVADTTTGRVEMQLNELSKVQQEALEMREQLRSSEEDLEQKRLENDRWHRHCEHLKQKLRESQRQLAESTTRQQQQATRIKDFEGRLSQIESEKASLLSQSLNDIRNQEEDMSTLQRKLQLANERIRIQDDTVAHHTKALEEAEKKAIEADQRAFRAERIAKTFETETDASRTMVRDYKQAKRSEEALRYEIEHLKLDNARMVRLLSTTKEYGEFLEFAENNRGISYVSSAGHRGPANAAPRGGRNTGGKMSGAKSSSNIPKFDHSLVGQEYGAWGDVSVFSKVYGTGSYASKANEQPIDPITETDHWMPTDALHLAIDFRQRHMPHVSMDLINEFLQQMNEVWRRRGVRAVARAKAKYASQLQNYKRSNNHRVPYAEVVQKQKIAQLTKELENIRSKVGASGRGRVSTVKVAQEQKAMQTTLFTVEKLSREVANFAEENQKLQSELRRLQAQGSNTALGPGAMGDKQEDHDFMEGAAWFGRNAVHIMDRLSATVAQYCRDVHKQSSGVDDQTSSLLSQIEFVVNQCKTRMRRLFEGTLDAEGDVQKANQLNVAMPLSGLQSSADDKVPRRSQRAPRRASGEINVTDGDIFRTANESWASAHD
jgi:hypothetical protein